MNEQLLNQVRECSRLPSLPGVAVEVLQLTQERDTDIARIAKIVAKDPALTARVLRTVNSSYFGLSQQVSNLEQAMALIGIRTVKVLVLGFSLATDLIGTAPSHIDVSLFWKRSFYAAAAARAFSGILQAKQADASFLAALLMDVGMLALDQVLGEQYVQVVNGAGGHGGLCQRERAAFDLTHADVSAALGEHWKLPPAVREPMRLHHAPNGAAQNSIRQTAEIAQFASRCADIFVEGVPVEAMEDVRRIAARQYGICESKCDEMLCGIGQAGVEFCTLIEIPKPARTTQAGASAAGATKGALVVESAAAGESPRAPAAAASGGGGGGGAEQRRAPRVARDGSIAITPCCGDRCGQSIKVQFRDLSKNGIGLTHAEPVAVGGQFIVHMRRGGGGEESIPIVYTVVRCICKGPQRYEIGAQVAAVNRQQRGPEGTQATAAA